MVKRYGIVSAWAGHAVAPVQDGRFVDFADYAALQAENERLKAEVKVMEDNFAFAMARWRRAIQG